MITQAIDSGIQIWKMNPLTILVFQTNDVFIPLKTMVKRIRLQIVMISNNKYNSCLGKGGEKIVNLL